MSFETSSPEYLNRALDAFHSLPSIGNGIRSTSRFSKLGNWIGNNKIKVIIGTALVGIGVYYASRPSTPPVENPFPPDESANQRPGSISNDPYLRPSHQVQNFFYPASATAAAPSLPSENETLSHSTFTYYMQSEGLADRTPHVNLVEAAIHRAQERKLKLLQTITPVQLVEYQQIEKHFEEVHRTLKSLSLKIESLMRQKNENNQSNTSNQQKIRELDEAISSLRNQLIEFTENALKGFSNYRCMLNSPNLLASYSNLTSNRDKRPITLKLEGIRQLNERVLCKVVNQFDFVNKLTQLINEHKQFIFNNFIIGPFGSAHEWNFEIIPNYPTDAHNGGKIPCQITFKHPRFPHLDVFVKPRSAEIDQLILEIFKALNSIPSYQKSLDVILPEYKILRIDSNHSAWEFIPGKFYHLETYNDTKPLFEYIQSYVREEGLKRDLLRQLDRLFSVSRSINLSDLHRENILYRPGQGGFQLVPIDLESIQPNAATGLYGGDEPPPIPLSKEEKAIILPFKRKLTDTPSRLVIIETPRLLGPMSDTDLSRFGLDLANEIIENLHESYPGKKIVSAAELIPLLLKDMCCLDIPYFIQSSNGVFYLTENGLVPIVKGRFPVEDLMSTSSHSSGSVISSFSTASSSSTSATTTLGVSAHGAAASLSPSEEIWV